MSRRRKPLAPGEYHGPPIPRSVFQAPPAPPPAGEDVRALARTFGAQLEADLAAAAQARAAWPADVESLKARQVAANAALLRARAARAANAPALERCEFCGGWFDVAAEADERCSCGASHG